MSKPDNPPAFPHLVPHNPDFAYSATGMTLRDYFAGQAMHGLIARSGPGRLPFDEDIAKQAYRIAQAMLAEREKNRRIDQ